VKSTLPVISLLAHIEQVITVHHFDGKARASPSVVNSRVCSSVLFIVRHSRRGAPLPVDIADSGCVNVGLRDNAQR
jgi:hypothetical protein